MWSSTLKNPMLTLTHSRNNMSADEATGGIRLYDNNGGGYTLTAGEGYAITGYTFSFTADKAMTVTPGEGGAPQTCSASDKAGISASGLNDETARFTVSGGGSILVTDFTVSVARKLETDPTRRVVFKTTASGVPYRIPALARTNDGTLIAVADYRYCKADIGNGPIDIHFRLSTDDGQTWGEEAKLADGNDQLTGNDWRYAFGDPCIVADRESPNVVSEAVAVSYPAAAETEAPAESEAPETQEPAPSTVPLVRRAASCRAATSRWATTIVSTWLIPCVLAASA